MTDLFLGVARPSSAALASALGAEQVVETPPASAGHVGLEGWRAGISEGAAAERVVVCTWTDPGPATPLVSLSPDEWASRVEWPSALWFTACVAAVERCADGGSVVVVVERPATLDAPGHAATVAVADGLLNLVRSLAAVEGARGVRVNAVTTALHTVPDRLLGAAPALATFPGTVEGEVAGAVRMLLSADAAGVTGRTIEADGGR